MKKYFLLFALALLSACSPRRTLIKHLGPVQEPAIAPPVCELISVMPDSPAQKSGIKIGDQILKVNGTTPTDASAVSELIQNSPTKAALEVKNSISQVRMVQVSLNKDRPRLGASCDLTGWRKPSVSAAGNESITVFQGPYAMTLSGIIDKKVAFIRARITNQSERKLIVTLENFSVYDAQKQPLQVLTPYEVIYFMHGDDAVPMVKAKAPVSGVQSPQPSIAQESLIRRVAPTHKGKDNWSESDQKYVIANAEYLSRESLWPTEVEPGKWADGLIYFLETEALPVRIQATIEGYELSASFGQPVPSTERMGAEDLIKFFESQKKGTPMRLTLKNGKVFAGKYSSYDAINEIVWFDTPSGVVLTTSSFGLKHIVHAEVMAPEPKNEPAKEVAN